MGNIEKGSSFASWLYPEKTGTHAREHAKQTILNVIKISREPEYRDLITDNDRKDLVIAAYFHDPGYRGKELYWSGTQWEHPFVSKDFYDRALSIFPQLDCGGDRVRQATIKFLILNHDNTGFSFPAYGLLEGRSILGHPEEYGSPRLSPGTVVGTPEVEELLEEMDHRKVFKMLQILQEADSRLGDAKRTIAFSESRRIPIFSDDGGAPGIGMSMWQGSGLANVMLAANRAIIDAYTKTGQEFAWKMFCETRDFIRGMMEEELRKNPSKYTFFGDNVGELLRREDVEKYIWGSKNGDRFRESVRIQAVYPLETASLPLGIGFTKLASRLVGLQQLSFSTCIPEGYMADLALIRESLIKNYAIDILTQLSGSVEVITNGFLPNKRVMYKKFVLAPPVIDKDGELAEFSDNLENAGAWIALAKILNLPKLRVLYLS